MCEMQPTTPRALLPLHSPTTASYNGEKAIRHLHRSEISPAVLSWLKWLASVLGTSLFLSAVLGVGQQGPPPSSWAPRDVTGEQYTTASLPVRRDACSSGSPGNSDYGMPLRIGAVFIIMAVSALACGFPLMAVKFPGLNMPDGFFFAVRHFGTGVLIATAFCHLLPTAFSLLSDPCLPSFWTEDYPAMPGAIALAAILFITVVEMLLHPAHAHQPAKEADLGEKSSRRSKGQLIGRSRSIGRGLSTITRSASRALGDQQTRDQDPKDVDSIPPEAAVEVSTDRQQEEHIDEASVDMAAPTPQEKMKKEVMNCLLLEMGILFHSVFIGMALSVSINSSEFVILLIAISFHQTFEGLALGARIAAIDWPKKSMKPYFMVIAYGCTTPLGQAIGLAAHNAYSPDSKVGLILVGVMNAISSGLLVFASLVELLSEDLLTDESWRVLRGRRRVTAFLLIVAGAFGMSLVGAWA